MNIKYIALALTVWAVLLGLFYSGHVAAAPYAPVRAVYLNITDPECVPPYDRPVSVKFFDWHEIRGVDWCFAAQRQIIRRMGCYYTSCSVLPLPNAKVFK